MVSIYLSHKCVSYTKTHKFIYSTLLALLYSTVKRPQNYTTHYKELIMKCIWKLVKDFHTWDSNEIHYDIVLAQIYKFLKVIKTTI